MSLGRGLNSLISQSDKNNLSENTYTSTRILHIPLKEIEPNPDQPRKSFSEAKIQELEESIKKHGVIQPLIVQKKEKNKFQIIAGERRFRACKSLKKDTVPAIVRVVDKSQDLELSLIENIQREDLNPIERARAYNHFIKGFGLTQEEISKKLGQSRSAIANTLRLLKLPEEIKKAIEKGKINEGHARLLLSINEPQKQIIALKRILGSGWTVRETKNNLKKQFKNKKEIKGKFYQEERELSNILDAKVKITTYKNKNKITIKTYSKGDIKRIINRLK